MFNYKIKYTLKRPGMDIVTGQRNIKAVDNAKALEDFYSIYPDAELICVEETEV